MNRNMKKIFFVSLLLFLLVGLAAVSASDDLDNTLTDSSDVITPTLTDSVETKIIEDTTDNKIVKETNNNELVKESKNLKSTPANHNVNSLSNWNNLFTSTGLASTVNAGDNIVFNTDITTLGTSSYTINKPINIIGNDHTLKVTTTSNNKKSLNFISSAAGSNVTDLKLLNTQVFVTTSQNIIFDNITAVNSQTGLGQGTGSFAIRDGCINITVKNSDFTTTTNGGYSTLVLTWVKDCTIDNNTITGTGNVGNLVYLNNYGANANSNGITNNSHNTISNNTISATNNGVFCYSLVISGANNTIINNQISNGYTYAITTIWAGSYDTETDPEDTHNVSYHGNKYINNTVGGDFSTGNYSIVKDNSITGTSTIVGNANVTNNIFVGTVNLNNDICFKENDASAATVNVILPNCHFKDNQINVLNIPTDANPTYDCGGNVITTTNGNLQPCNCGGTCCQSGSNIQFSTKTTNMLKSEATPDTVDNYYGTWIDDNTWEVNVTEENFNQIFPQGSFEYIWLDDYRSWYDNLYEKNLIFNIYYLPSDHYFGSQAYMTANVTFHFMKNVTINNELFSRGIDPDHTFYSDGNITINCDEDYFWVEYDQWGYVSESHGFDLLTFAGDSTVKNLVYNLNISEDQLDVGNLNYDNYYCAVNGDNLTLQDCTFNIQLPRNIKTYSTGWDTVKYNVQLLGSDTVLGELHYPQSGNFTIINCTFNINSLAEDEDEYPYLFTNLGLADNQKIIFRGNTINLNKVRGIQLATDNGIIENNTINTNYDYAVELIGNSNTVQNNVLIAKEYKGNDAVLVIGENNIVQNNGPTEEQAELTLIIDTTEFTANTNTRISASIYSGEEKMESLNSGKVTIKVNGKTLKDTYGKVIYAKVVNGTACIENYEVPNDWAKEGTTIQAVYSGSTQVDKLTSNKTDITVTASEPEFTTESITAQKGDTITLTATITDGDKSINSGKVVFKVNGKTVKDTNGKVIYKKIQDNTVSVEYTIPESFKAKEYNITAVLISSDYDSMEDTKTLTVTA